MKRNIRFRVWDKTEKRMLKPFGFSDLYGHPVGNVTIEFEGKDIVDKDFILMQYIGLKDKNGLDVYEGDLVEFPTGIIAEVDFAVGSFQCRFDDGTGSPAALQNKSFKVIGNKYENKRK